MEACLRERDIKLDLFAALARSQHALARLLECAAAAGEASPEAARLIRDNTGLLAALQRTFAESASGLQLRGPAAGRTGTTAGPWLRSGVFSPAARSRQRGG